MPRSDKAPNNAQFSVLALAPILAAVEDVELSHEKRS
jgi:hypothetical protein